MIEIVKGLLFSLLLIAAAIWDIKKREIPNLIPLLLLLAGLIRIKPLDAVFGLILTGLPYFIAAVCVRRSDGFAIGGGDIKLMMTAHTQFSTLPIAGYSVALVCAVTLAAKHKQLLI